MIEIIRILILSAGYAIAVAGVLAIWAFLVMAIFADAQSVVGTYIQSRKDAKLFNRIEEFRRDFS